MSKFPLQNPPIFICGVQRAGTTLLVKMLSKNEHVNFLPHETHFFPLLWNPSGKINQVNDVQELSELLLKKLPEANYGWTKAMPFLESYCAWLKDQNDMPGSTETLLASILQFWEKKQAKPVITGEKTPSHIYYTLNKLKEFPGCKIVIMVRDPRAAALSEKIKLDNNKRVERTFNAFNFIVRWSTAVKLAQKFSKKYDQVKFIRYEDLITAPESTLSSVCDILKIDYDISMLDVGVTNSSFQDNTQKGIQFNTANLDRWKTNLAPEIIAKIEYHLNNELVELGYELTNSNIKSIPKKQLLVQKAKLKIARKACLAFPARFHHIYRNKKYKLDL